MSPSCFDELYNTIKDHPVFHNNSNNLQMPVDVQLVITLHWFSHYRNAASVMKIALWARVGYGSIPNVTMCMMMVLCNECFCRVAMAWPNHTKIEHAKEWVEHQSSPAWVGGWSMVNGALVPLFQRPHYYGNTFFCRKLNYSMNVQVCSSFVSLTFKNQVIHYGCSV
jgi:hypothetical protein